MTPVSQCAIWISVRLIDCAPVCLPAYEDATVALRSLGIEFDAPVEEIFDMARDHQLSKLFVRTDNRQPAKTRSGGQALKELMAITTDEKRRRTWRQAQVELMGMRWGTPLTPQQEQLEAMRHKTSRQKWLETEAMRWPE